MYTAVRGKMVGVSRSEVMDRGALSFLRARDRVNLGRLYRRHISR